ncbi:MAG: GNAT family N-acetyltransferase [Candidatus Lokiarchaeota archaeon]|nr:GNAT family N-acetyltransferase [Candidatus Lokiarchaeota archaeon]
MKELLDKIIAQEGFNKPKKIQHYDIKFYDNSDFQDLMHLYHRVFPGFMSEKLWYWKNIHNPSGQFITVLLKDEKRVVAAYSVAPRRFYINKKSFFCVQSMDTMTDEDYRGLGISTYLARVVYEYSRLKGAHFVYGFPNRNSWYLFEKKLYWKTFGKMTLYQKDLSIMSKRCQKMDSYYQINPILNFEENFLDFWESSKNNYNVVVEKNLRYLKWRFNEHPFVKYKKYFITEKSKNKIIAYFVLKHYQDEKELKRGHIVDYMIEPKEFNLKLDIFQLIEFFSSKEFRKECVSISFWTLDDDIKSLVLNELGYQAMNIDTHFGYKIFSNDEELKLLHQKNNWHITMSDNDVF